ncbi:MAG: RNA methyltransferase [Gammaproteobacteria bacterium]|nr:RNA methyltransferase [Gammaproteobacteria bacterium]
MFANIKIVLVETSHPGNIGATARAMKTMGVTQLSLVNPQKQFPHVEATARAVGADDILVNAQVVTSLDDALANCAVIIGTSARLRRLTIPLLDSHECAQLVSTIPIDNNIAIIFGRENSGLTNDELNRCHYHIHIPTAPEYTSLNLAAAVQIVCYELRMAQLNKIDAIESSITEPLATDHEIQLFYDRLEKTLIKIDFLDPEVPRKLMPRFKRMYNRIQLEKTELDLLMGMLKNINKL